MPACLALGCIASSAEGSGDRREPVPVAGVNLLTVNSNDVRRKREEGRRIMMEDVVQMCDG